MVIMMMIIITIKIIIAIIIIIIIIICNEGIKLAKAVLSSDLRFHTIKGTWQHNNQNEIPRMVIHDNCKTQNNQTNEQTITPKSYSVKFHNQFLPKLSSCDPKGAISTFPKECNPKFWIFSSRSVILL